MEGKQEEDREEEEAEEEAERESSKWFQGAGPRCRERGASRMLSFSEDLKRTQQLTHCYARKYKGFLGI